MIEKLKSKITQVPGLSNRADVLPPSFFSLGDQSSESLASMFQEICLVHDLSTSLSNSKDNTHNQHIALSPNGSSPEVIILIWLTQTKPSPVSQFCCFLKGEKRLSSELESLHQP